MEARWSQYDLTAELAKKYSHVTYLASPTTEPEHQVILTVYASSLFRFPRERENWLQKVQRLKDCHHPYLVPILDMGIEEGQPFVVREYLPNKSLRSHLKQISPDRMELREALTIMSQVGQALVYLHQHHLIHGNVKPENILLQSTGQAVLTDISLIGGDAIIRDQSTQEYAFCYLSPEQFAGTSDARSDQYALGCLTYELITGQVPFAAQSLASMMGQPSYAVPAPLSQCVANLPASLEVAVLKMLARDPAERFFDFSLFLEVIGSVLSPPPAFPLLRSPSSRKGRTTSHPAPSVQAGTVFSPIHKGALKLATPERDEPSEIPSGAQDDMLEPVGAALLIDVSELEHTEMLSAPESLASALPSQLFPASLSPQTDLADTGENAPHSLKGQKDEEASARMFEAISPAEDLTTELVTTMPMTEEELDDVLLTDPFVEEEEDLFPMRAAISAVHKQYESEMSKISSSLMISTNVSRPQSVRTLRVRRGSLGLVLVLSVILSLVLALLWPSGIFTNTLDQLLPIIGGSLPPILTSDRPGAHVMGIPLHILVPVVPVQKSHLPSSPTAVASSNLNIAAASYNPNTGSASKLNVEKNTHNLPSSNPNTGGGSSGSSTATVTPTPAPVLGGVCYQAHVQNIGWQDQICDGAMAGTTGQSLRLEAIQINLVNAPPTSQVCYQAHVQNIGWQDQVCDGAMAGTTGQSLRLEAIQINLVNAPPTSHICYQAYVQDSGWQDQVCDGAMAGTTGQSLRLEAIQIVVSN